MSNKILKLSKNAEKLVAENRLEEATNVYKKICKIDPKNPSAWMILGSYTAQLKKFSDAEDAFKKAYKLQSSNIQSAEYLAQVLEIQGKYSEAAQILETIYNKTSDTSLTMKLGA